MPDHEHKRQHNLRMNGYTGYSFESLMHASVRRLSKVNHTMLRRAKMPRVVLDHAGQPHSWQNS